MNVVDTGNGVFLYTIVGDSGDVYYVGITGNLSNRTANHKYNVCRFIKEHYHINTVRVYNNKEDAHEAELELTKKLINMGHPIMNGKRNAINLDCPKKVVSYYLKTENDDFLKKHAEHIGRSKNYILDILIQNLRKDVSAKRDNNEDAGI